MKDRWGYYLMYFILFTAIVLDLIIFYAVMEALDIWEKDVRVALIGFVGSLLGGLLTLVGVRWTIKEQRQLFYIEKFEKASYIYKKISPKMFSLNSFIKDIDGTNVYENLNAINGNTEAFLKILNDQSEILMQTEFTFISKIEFIETWVKEIYDYTKKETSAETIDPSKSDEKIKHDLLTINNFIQSIFDEIQNYIRSNSTR